jgi:DNA-binding IclR family transcriptional regulator
MNPNKARGVQSIHRAIALLRAVVAHSDRGARLSDLARSTQLHSATARRMLNALVSEGLLTFDPVSRFYHLGIELFYFGAAAHQFKIRDRYRATLERVSRKTEDTTYLVIRSGNDVLCIDRVEGSYPIRALTHHVGMRVPLGIGAGSLTILAFSADPQREEVIRANRLRYRQYNNRTEDDIRSMIRQARRQGYAVSEGNVMPGAIAVGVPVLDQNGQVVAAISVSAVSQRMSKPRREEISKLLKDEIAAVSASAEDAGQVYNVEHGQGRVLRRDRH